MRGLLATFYRMFVNLLKNLKAYFLISLIFSFWFTSLKFSYFSFPYVHRFAKDEDNNQG